MARILVLAKSGFGKSTSIGKEDKLGIIGLNPTETFIISSTSKNLPFANSLKDYAVTPYNNIKGGRRVITNKADQVVIVLTALLNIPNNPFKNIILDDFNYIMQDYYMEKALSSGWDAPKKVGSDIGKIFAAIEKFDGTNKNIIVLAHSEDVPQPDGRIYAKLKTTGKMVDEYVTPEGKFDIVLVGKSTWDTAEKKPIKQYVTNEDEYYSSPKSPYGMFEDLYMPNDLGKIVEKVNKFYLG